MPRILMLAVVLLAAAAAAQEMPPGVVLPESGHFGEGAQLVAASGPVSVLPAVESALTRELPPDDRGQFRIAVFFRPGDGPSEQLIRDFQQSPYLRPYTQWGVLARCDVTSASQTQRMREYRIDPAKAPVVWVFPSRFQAKFPYSAVCVRQGYDGDARAYSVWLYENLRAFYAAHSPRGQCPGPCPIRPQPYQPDPYEPDVDPYQPTPDQEPITPDLPDVWPPDDEDRDQPDGPDLPPDDEPDAPAGFPDYPEIVLVLDPDGIGEDIDAAGLERLARWARGRFGLAAGAKARVVRIGTPAAVPYAVEPEDTPALVVTSRGRVIGVLTRGLREILREHLHLPDPPPGPPEEPSLLDGLTDRLDQAVDSVAAAVARATLTALVSIAALVLLLAAAIAAAVALYRRFRRPPSPAPPAAQPPASPQP